MEDSLAHEDDEDGVKVLSLHEACVESSLPHDDDAEGVLTNENDIEDTLLYEDNAVGPYLSTNYLSTRYRPMRMTPRTYQLMRITLRTHYPMKTRSGAPYARTNCQSMMLRTNHPLATVRPKVTALKANRPKRMSLPNWWTAKCCPTIMTVKEHLLKGAYWTTRRVCMNGRLPDESCAAEADLDTLCCSNV
jgi:hypothetical protein